MEAATDITVLAERLSLARWSSGSAAFFVALLRKLALGRPVSRNMLADVLGWSVANIEAELARTPSIEYDDDGNIVGYGLTLRETPHVIEIDGQRLYTWCALDALMFPALLGKSAHLLSRCPATGELVSLTVAPDGLHQVEPAGVVVSLVQPDASSDIRRSFCCSVHFFASVAAADDWLAQHQGAEVVSVQDAFRLGQEVARPH